MALGRRLGNLYSPAQTLQSPEPAGVQDIGQPPIRPLPLVPDVREHEGSWRAEEFEVYECKSSASSVLGDSMVSPPPRPGRPSRTIVTKGQEAQKKAPLWRTPRNLLIEIKLLCLVLVSINLPEDKTSKSLKQDVKI